MLNGQADFTESRTKTMGLLGGLRGRRKRGDDGKLDLCNAAYAGDVDRVRELLEAKEDPNQLSPDGKTPLQLACSFGTPMPYSQLKVAIETYDEFAMLEIVKMLVDAGADINARDSIEMGSFGFTPLLYACGAAPSVKRNVIAFLLANGAKPNAKSKFDQTALSFLYQEGETALADLCIKHGAVLDRKAAVEKAKLDRHEAFMASIDPTGDLRLDREVARGAQTEQLDDLVLEPIFAAVSKTQDPDQVNLTKGQRVVFLVSLLHYGVTNGGFDQYFFNSSGDLAPEALQALGMIGAPMAQNLLAEAMKQFPDIHYPTSRRARMGIMEQLPEITAAQWNRLDSQFYASNEDIIELVRTFIRNNPAEFVK